ncbi:MAG: hypothetical protein WC147_12020 [Syntrophomonas sp.]|jgi:hypothetical protein
MNEIKKTPVEEAQGIAGFLIPEQVLPNNLVAYFGLGSSITMTVSGQMKKINDSIFFEVEGWKLGRR